MTAHHEQPASSPPGPRGLLTIDEAAAYLSIPKATLYTWRTRRPGYGPRAVKAGGMLRYRLSDLDDWILSHTEEDPDVPEPTPITSSRGKASPVPDKVRPIQARPSRRARP